MKISFLRRLILNSLRIIQSIRWVHLEGDAHFENETSEISGYLDICGQYILDRTHRGSSDRASVRAARKSYNRER